jgi:hypothetical protein
MVVLNLRSMQLLGQSTTRQLEVIDISPSIIITVRLLRTIE